MTTLRFALCGVSFAALASAASAQDSDLLVFDYAGYEDPAYHTAYIDAHGASPEFSFFGDEEEAFQKLRSGFKADVTHICAGSVTKFVESGIVEPWDLSKIPAFGDLNRDLTGQQIGGDAEVYFMPTDYGSTAIAYNADEVPAEDVKTLDVFKNPKYAGRLTLPDNVDDAYALAYLATGTTDWSTATDEQFEAASAWLREVHPNLRTYWVEPAELSQLLATGEVLVSWAWNETFPTMKEENFPIGFERESVEGSSLWLCGYVNMVDGQGSEDKAYDYINAVLAPSSTAPLMDAGFGHSNATSMEGFGVDALIEAGLGPVSVPILAQLPMSIELREKQSATFERIKSGF